MYCIYWKNKVGQAVAKLCEYQNIPYEMLDDSNGITSFDRFEAIIPSPWVPGTHPVYKTGKVLAELDFAYQFLPRGFQIVSVTGTDGKSTTAWIVYNILQKEFGVKNINSAQCTVHSTQRWTMQEWQNPTCPLWQRGIRPQKSVYLSGNFEIPFSATVLDILKKWEKKGIIVIEVSSFMSHAIKDFQSDYTIFTNLKSDHLNWHRDLQEYIDAKMSLVQHTSKRSIINEEVLEFAREKGLNVTLPENVRGFSKLETLNSKFEKTFDELRIMSHDSRDFIDGEDIVISGRKKYKLSETRFTGFHNAMNLLSVGLLANEMGICSKRMKQYFSEITGLPHRLEKIWEKNGITFVEDSKSTSSQSLEAALGSYAPVKNEKWKMKNIDTKNQEPRTKNLLLIVGGSDKWDSFVHLGQKFWERVKAMVCIGATKEQFVAIAKQEGIPYLAIDSLVDAVSWLYSQWQKNDVLILSPGCASFGLFRDYLDRANQFREAIKGLS
jgi:UDP-N-acetylmuramoylalanine--D-glutamate ligase